MSTSTNVLAARFQFGRDPDQQLPPSSEEAVDDLAVRRWFRGYDRGRDLGRAELEVLVDDLCTRPQLWRHLIRRSRDRRHYVRLLLDRHVEVWLICWCRTQDTGFHDHDGSSGAVGVVAGAVTETLLRVDGVNPITLHPTGARFSFGGSHIHDVQHAKGDPAASLHVYSPPLRDMGFYEAAGDGTLQRFTADAEREFC